MSCPTRRKSSPIYITFSLVVLLLLCLVACSECRSLKEIIKGKGKYIPEDCGSCEPGCKSGTEVCKEKIIYGDVIVCHCIPKKYADIPISIVDTSQNQFYK